MAAAKAALKASLAQERAQGTLLRFHNGELEGRYRAWCSAGQVRIACCAVLCCASEMDSLRAGAMPGALPTRCMLHCAKPWPVNALTSSCASLSSTPRLWAFCYAYLTVHSPTPPYPASRCPWTWLSWWWLPCPRWVGASRGRGVDCMAALRRHLEAASLRAALGLLGACQLQMYPPLPFVCTDI